MRGLLKFLSIMAILAGMYYVRYYLAYRQVEKYSSFFVTESVNKISDGWNIDELKKVADPALAKDSSVANAFVSYRKLGALTKPASCSLQDFTSYKYEGASANYISATYECRAEFKNGPASMRLTILRYQDSAVWKISYFDVVSSFLVTPAAK